MDRSIKRAKARSYYHAKVPDSTPMLDKMPSSGHLHPTLQSQDVTDRHYATSLRSVDESRERFSGYGRTAQVLRWVSSAALKHSPGGKNRFTEVQAGFVGKRLIVGSNANVDPLIPTTTVRDPNPIGTAIKSALGSTITAPTTEPADENERVTQQRDRHISQLQSFVNDDTFFQAFVENAVGEARGSRKKATERQLLGIRKSLQNMLDDKGDGFRVISAGNKDATRSGPSYHAEQRVLDYAIEHHDALMDEVASVKGIDKRRIHKMRMTVAGTKPPCHRCRTTEEHRVAEDESEKSHLKTYRFETDSGGLFPAGGSGAVYSRMQSVETGTKDALTLDLAGSGSTTVYQEPIMRTDFSGGTARARRDSIVESFDSDVSGKRNVGRR